MKIAIVHDFLTYWGGAEQVLLSFHRIWPDAPIYTLLYDEKIVNEYFPNAKIKASFLQKFPLFLRRRKKYILPLAGIAPETIDLKDYDLVISSSSSFAKGVIVKPKTIHISYCHTPTRFLWDWYFEYLRENKLGTVKKSIAVLILHYLRMWDKSVADRIDYFIANSQTTKRRIEKFYRAKSEVIYPPVDVNKYSSKSEFASKEKIADNIDKKGYFLIVSRLSAYKKIDSAIEAFNKLDWPLYIVGDGEQKKYLESIAGKNIKFLGFVKEDCLPDYYRNARALILPGEDDFGITAVEAMASGTPVIALREGGAPETIIEGVTGTFFDHSVSPLIAEAVIRFIENEKKYDREAIVRCAQKYSRARFETEIKDYVHRVVSEEKNDFCSCPIKFPPRLGNADL